MIRRPAVDLPDPCVWCGYDLRENQPATPCPECGRAFGDADPRLLDPRVIAPLRNSTRLLLWSVPAVTLFLVAAVFAPVGWIASTVGVLLVLAGFAGLLRLLRPLGVPTKPLAPVAGMALSLLVMLAAISARLPAFTGLSVLAFVLILGGWASTLTVRVGRQFDHSALETAGRVGQFALVGCGVLVTGVGAALLWRYERAGSTDAWYQVMEEVYVPVVLTIGVFVAGAMWILCMRRLTRFFDRVWASMRSRRQRLLVDGNSANG